MVHQTTPFGLTYCYKTQKGSSPAVCASGSCHKLKHPFTEAANVTDNHLQLKAKIIGVKRRLKSREMR
ncbi:hypothetical protein EHJ15_05600 [Cronobacter muytjensii]|nr:hypothetical protein [Cronobacter muytjensii]